MSSDPIELTLLPREDGGLRLYSTSHPGLVLSGPRPEEVLACVWPALLALRAHQQTAPEK